MKKTIAIAILAGAMNCFAQAPNYLWAKSAGTIYGEAGYSTALDASGNSYVTGWFGGSSITFGSITLTNAGMSFADMFVVKYDASGNVVWAKSAGGSSADQGNSIAADASGNTYVTGFFQSSSITFGSITLTNSGLYNIFIVKYDAGGNVIWAKSVGGSSGNGIAIDGSGNAYITGYFYNSSIIFGSTTLTGSGNQDMFIVKYDASGNVVWAKSAGGSSDDEGLGIAVDGSGNSCITGYFRSSSITIGSTVLINSGIINVFSVKYDASGNVIWAKSAGGSSTDYGKGIIVDGSGNTYVAGFFVSSSIAFGSITLTHTGTYDMFIVKYDGSGNEVWAQSTGGIAIGGGIAVDGSGNTYVTGSFKSSSIIFGSTTLTNADGSGNTNDMFIAKYDTSGNVIWAKSAGGSSDDYGQGIAVDGSGIVSVTSYFQSSSIAFGSTTLTNAGGGSADMYIAKLNTTTGIEKILEEGTFIIAPNPFASQTIITYSEEQRNTTIKITDIIGKELKTINFTGRQLVIDKGEMKAGIYFLQTIDQEAHICNMKIIIQ